MLDPDESELSVGIVIGGWIICHGYASAIEMAASDDHFDA